MSQSGPEKDTLFQELEEESEEWRSPADFYLEADTTTRGLTLVGDSLASESPFKDVGLDVDFYSEKAPVHKGIALGGLDEIPAARYPSLTCSQSLPDTRAARFSETHWPPHAPTDSFFKFGLTTLYVFSSMPHEIGNMLLEFFTTEVISTLSKVRHAKFSIKANVFDESYAMCTMKVRVFHQDSRHFAIEFQRRQGDAVAFNRVFKKASHYLKLHLGMAVDAPGAPGAADFAALALPEQRASGVDEANMGPLLDMARFTALPSLQAEAAAALATMAKDDGVALKLCTERAFEDVKMLFQSSAPEVDYPTAHLTHLLAQRPEGVSHFAQRDILPLMTEKIRSISTCTPVREELARGLSVAVQKQSKATLRHSVELAQAVDDCIKEVEGVGSHTVVQSLRSAQMVLSSL